MVKTAPLPPIDRVVIHWRPSSGGRWKVIGEAATYGAAVRLIQGPGDWWLNVIYTKGGPTP